MEGTNNETDICVICLENIDSSTHAFGCGHKFHKMCTYKYACNQLKNNFDFTCPTCRFVQCPANTQVYNNLVCEMGIQQHRSTLIPPIIVYVQPQERVVRRRSIIGSFISGLRQCREPIAM